jgi:3D (Asp-Asp-Asp) domain-containing protein
MRDINIPCGLIFGTFMIGVFAGVYLNIYTSSTDDTTRSVETGTEPQLFDEIEMNVSGYCPCSKCCQNFADGITASGVPAVGKLIAAPGKYEFKTKMYVPGYGTAPVMDRGGAIKGNKIDLLFCDKDGVSGHQRALNWGRQYLTVRVYK